MQSKCSYFIKNCVFIFRLVPLKYYKNNIYLCVSDDRPDNVHIFHLLSPVEKSCLYDNYCVFHINYA